MQQIRYVEKKQNNYVFYYKSKPKEKALGGQKLRIYY